MDQLISAMIGAGFTRYEASVYVAMIQRSPSSGYELAKVSGVPLAKVYEVLARLSARGAAAQVSSDPALYAPVPPEQLLYTLRRNYSDLCDIMQAGFSELERKSVPEYVWNLMKREDIVAKADEICESTQQILRIICWNEDLSAIERQVAQAVARNVRVVVVGYGITDMPGCTLIPHETYPRVIRERGRQLVVVGDDSVALVSSLAPIPSGMWSCNPGLVGLARELVMHEFYLWRVVARLGPEIRKEFGQDLEGLRDL